MDHRITAQSLFGLSYRSLLYTFKIAINRCVQVVFWLIFFVDGGSTVCRRAIHNAIIRLAILQRPPERAKSRDLELKKS